MSKQDFNRRTGLKLLGAGLASAALAGCGGGTGLGIPGFETAPATPPVAPPGAGGVPVGLILPLTAQGPGGVAGNALRNAAEMALAEFPGANVRLIIKDDAGTPEGARTAAQEALAEGAEIILGPLFAPSVQAAAAVARPAGRPMIAFSTDSAVAAPGVYLLSFMAEVEVQRVLIHAAAQGRRSFGALIPDTAYGRVVEAAFTQTAAQRGLRIVAVERFALDQIRLQEAVTKLSAAFAQMDALFLPETADTLPAIGGALAAVNLNTQRIKLIGTGVWNDARVFRIPQLQGGWFAAPDAAGFNAFAGRYQQRFGSAPTRIATLSYTAVTLVAALARQQGTQRFSPQVLTNPSGFEGVDGLFRFRADGQIDRGLAVLEVRNGSAVTISPAPREFPRTA